MAEESTDRLYHRIQKDLEQAEIGAWPAATIWIIPVGIILGELHDAFALILLVPLAALIFMLLRLFGEMTFNYDSHVPPYDGTEEALGLPPRWALIMLAIGFFVTLVVAGESSPEIVRDVTGGAFDAN